MSFPKKIPFPLSQRIASATSALYSRQGREFDVAIGGVPFMLATSADLTGSVETIQVRKDQVDTEDPGEQSLTGYWRRSQSTFHEGAGNLYQETTLNANSFRPIPGNGFYASSGVSVFEKGKVTLLKKMKAATVAGGQYSHIRSFAINSTRTNLSTNPNMELDAAGWTVGSGAEAVPSVARSTARFKSGVASLLCTFNADDGVGLPPFIQYNFATTIGQVYTASAQVYVPTGTVAIQILIGGVAFGVANTGALKDQWVRLFVTFTATGVTSPLQFWPVTPTAAAQTFNIDEVLIENSAILGDYFDGSSANSAWTGTTNASTSVQTITSGSASFSAVADGTLHTSTAVSGSYAALHSPAGKVLVDGLISGSSFYDVASDGSLYQGLVSSPGTATTWPCGGSPKRLGWGKHRLWVIGGTKLWQPNLALVGGTSQAPIFTHPNAGWNYTCMAEGPGAMYFGGNDGFSSSIQAVTFDSGGGIPTLSGATVTAVLPDGELVQELAVVAGQFVGIGTNRGFRVGVVNSDNSITYGPLLVEPTGVSACTSVTSQGRFFVVGFRTTGDNALLYRIDTSVEINASESTGVFAYAADIDLGFVGAITSVVAASTTQLACTASDGKVYYQSLTEYVDYGYIQSGRIRFRTTEPKTFRFVGLGIEPLQGSIAVSLVKSDLSAFPLGSITTQGQIFTDQFFYGGGPMEFASIKVELTPTANKLAAPVVTSTLLRALPAVRPQRLITLALLCFNSEQSRSGQRYGGQSFAADRLNAMLSLEDGAQVLTYQDFSGALGNHQVTIESMKFASTVPPTGAGGTGGVIVIQLRTVDS